jgi:hypothetical protein
MKLKFLLNGPTLKEVSEGAIDAFSNTSPDAIMAGSIPHSLTLFDQPLEILLLAIAALGFYVLIRYIIRKIHSKTA